MPGTRRRRLTTEQRAAWLKATALAYHAGQVDADTYRRVIEQAGRHADPRAVLDQSAKARTV